MPSGKRRPDACVRTFADWFDEYVLRCGGSVIAPGWIMTSGEQETSISLPHPAHHKTHQPLPAQCVYDDHFAKTWTVKAGVFDVDDKCVREYRATYTKRRQYNFALQLRRTRHGTGYGRQGHSYKPAVRSLSHHFRRRPHRGTVICTVAYTTMRRLFLKIGSQKTFSWQDPCCTTSTPGRCAYRRPTLLLSPILTMTSGSPDGAPNAVCPCSSLVPDVCSLAPTLGSQRGNCRLFQGTVRPRRVCIRWMCPTWTRPCVRRRTRQRSTRTWEFEFWFGVK